MISDRMSSLIAHQRVARARYAVVSITKFMHVLDHPMILNCWPMGIDMMPYPFCVKWWLWGHFRIVAQARQHPRCTGPYKSRPIIELRWLHKHARHS